MVEEAPTNVIVQTSTGAGEKKLSESEKLKINDRNPEIVDSECLDKEQTADNEQVEDVQERECIKSEYSEGEFLEGEEIENEQIEIEAEEKIQDELEVIISEREEHVGARLEEVHKTEDTGGKTEVEPYDELVGEEEAYIEEPPPDPAAPYNFSDSQELLKAPYELRPDQIVEVEQLWAIYQNYTPAYTDLDNYITEKELIYMLKSLVLMTYTPEQLQELINFCVRPPNPQGHITYEQFLKMVTIRQRDLHVEEELRAALQVFDPGKTGTIDRDYFREILGKMGNKMPPRQLDHLIKEVDISNDGTVGIDDIVGTMCIDLNRDDIIMLREAIYPSVKYDGEKQHGEDDF